ncbi:peptidoglycan amidohydrolase family protein [Weissella minor]|uniref:peptidoglycan amidohydrolase family protein n=1 Tax=Weissella minor TaxID=1620 RepID=UPI003AF2AC0B
MENKKRFKLYKSGKLWVTATVGFTALITGTSANADVTVSTEQSAPQQTNVDATQTSTTTTNQTKTEASLSQAMTAAVTSAAAEPASNTKKAPASAETTQSQASSKSTEVAQSQASSQSAEATQSQASSQSVEAAQSQASSQSVEATQSQASSKSTEATQSQASSKSTEATQSQASSKSTEATQSQASSKSTEAAQSQASSKSTEAAQSQASSKSTEAKSKATPQQRNLKVQVASTATVKNGWVKNQYFRNGKAVTGSVKIDGKWYLFDKNGNATTGLYRDNKGIQYYDASYVQLRNGYYHQNAGITYYFDNTGYAISGVRKFKDANGKLQIEAYRSDNYKQIRNAHYKVNTNTTYYLGNDGKAIRGLRQYKDANGKLQIEAYHHDTLKMMQNDYYRINKKSKYPGAYYLGADGKAIRGIRQFKDANGKLQIEAYHHDTLKMMQNDYYRINKKSKYPGAYYLGADGKAIRGIRQFKDANGKLQIEAYHHDTLKMMQNDYYRINKKSKYPGAYYLGADGKAIRGIRQFKDANGKLQIEAYNHDTLKMMQNDYYRINKKSKYPGAYYLGADGKAIRGIRQFKDANGNLQIEAYHHDTLKMMQNDYYRINKNSQNPSAYYLGKDGLAIKGERWFTTSSGARKLEYYDNNHKLVTNRYVQLHGKQIYFNANGQATNTNAQRLENTISWFKSREGKVFYSMYQRMGPNSYDCSSAVYFALKHAGLLPANTMIGNTETLFVDLEAHGWKAQPAGTTPQRGDIFIWGKRGTTLGAGGHTGIFTDSSHIIHCNYSDNGISTTDYNNTFARSGLGYATVYRLPRI